MRNSRIIYSVAIVIFLLLLIAPLLPASANLVAANPTFALYLPLIMKSGPTASRTPTPTVTPTPTSPSQSLINGDFESGPNVGWVTAGGAHIINESSLARNGSWYAQLGGSQGGSETLTQQVSVPVDKPYLSYWYKAISSQAECFYDVGFVWIDPNPNDADPGAFVDSVYDFCHGSTHSDYRKRVIDLHAYAGQTVQLQFDMDLTPNYASYWGIDDVMFQSTP